ncbi:MAG: DegT/DnrJ/EryC1/StrS family aminotransferase [Pirellulaceae bacterium]
MKQAQIRVAEPVLDGNESKYVAECIDETWISSSGRFIDQFEAMLASFCNVREAVVTNNGTSALHLALAACGIDAGDEVILPTLTYVATGNSLHYCNATPVFVDSESKYLNVDVRRIERAITPRTKAIMTVPLYGHPVDFDPIQDIAERHDLMIIEDSAEALGAKYRGRRVGSLAKCSTFSFFGNKLITTGEGGAITTDDPELAARMRFLRGQGVDANRRYWHPEIGYNFRMTNVAAAIGVAQMERIDDKLSRRQQVAQWYFERLRDATDILQLPEAAPWAEHSYWMFTVLLQPDVDVDRDQWMKSLAESGIETRPVFYPLHWMPHFRKYKGYFPVADHCSSRGINLPTHGNLTQSDVDFVCETMLASIEKLRGRRTAAAARAA